MHADPKTGRLQYLTKGSSVIPHNLTAELMKIADIGAEGLTMPKFDSGVNLVTNAISKPELNLEFENLLHIDNCSNEVLHQVKRLVAEEFDKFSRTLNYSLKRIGAK